MIYIATPSVPEWKSVNLISEVAHQSSLAEGIAMFAGF